MSEPLAAHLAFASLVWTGVFHVFGVVGYLAHSHRSVFHVDEWLSSNPSQPPRETALEEIFRLRGLPIPGELAAQPSR